jgi:hypothetical protein
MLEASATHPEPFYVCCHCEPNEILDDNALSLMRKHCPIHGECWHRLMVIALDGKMELAVPAKPEVKVYG